LNFWKLRLFFSAWSGTGTHPYFYAKHRPLSIVTSPSMVLKYFTVRIERASPWFEIAAEAL
jgi:hypothetical protein